MQYLGGKYRIRKWVSGVLNSYRKPGQVYIEPFCGGLSIFSVMGSPKVASDLCPYVIALYKAIQKGWSPPDQVSESEYAAIKNNKSSYPPELVGFVGYGVSFGGKFFGGYARGTAGRCYAKNARNSLVKKFLTITPDAQFHNVDYQAWSDTKGALIYCDPPYEGTTKYKHDADHKVFWQWVRDMSESNTVIVSSYNAPVGFEEIGVKHRNLEMQTGKKTTRKEKLFKHVSDQDMI